MESINQYGWLIALSFNVMLALALFAMKSAFVGRLEHDQAVGDLRARVGRVEQRVEELPDRDMVHRLSLEMAALTGQLAVMTERVAAVNHALERVDRQVAHHGAVLADANGRR